MEMTSILPTLYEALTDKYGAPREGVHISDISICPRESIFRRLQPQKIENITLGFFVFGESAGAAIAALVKSDPDRWVAEYEVKYEGMEAHIDLMDVRNNIPVEVKTANMADMEQPKSHYTTQLRAYMAMTHSTTGIILVFLTQHYRGKNKGPFKEWVISMTPAQLEAERQRLVKEKVSFEAALKAGKPELARHVMDDKDMNWKCQYCKFVSACQEMNRGRKAGERA